MNYKLLIILLVIAVAGVTGTYYFQHRTKAPAVATEQQQNVSPAGQTAPPPQQVVDPYKDMQIPQDRK